MGLTDSEKLFVADTEKTYNSTSGKTSNANLFAKLLLMELTKANPSNEKQLKATYGLQSFARVQQPETVTTAPTPSPIPCKSDNYEAVCPKFNLTGQAIWDHGPLSGFLTKGQFNSTGTPKWDHGMLSSFLAHGQINRNQEEMSCCIADKCGSDTECEDALKHITLVVIIILVAMICCGPCVLCCCLRVLCCCLCRRSKETRDAYGQAQDASLDNANAKEADASLVQDRGTYAALGPAQDTTLDRADAKEAAPKTRDGCQGCEAPTCVCQ